MGIRTCRWSACSLSVSHGQAEGHDPIPRRWVLPRVHVDRDLEVGGHAERFLRDTRGSTGDEITRDLIYGRLFLTLL